MKPTALLLNLFVAAISFALFAQSGFFRWKLFLVFSLLSIPFSFWGGTMNIDPTWYKVILGILLLFAIARMLGLLGKQSDKEREIQWIPGLLIGASIGFFSGLIGIGGGIVLSPVILILGWGNVKEAAAVSALFIWVNSAAGMGGQLITGVEVAPMAWWFVLIAVIGGFLGGYVGSKRLDFKMLRYLLAFVLILASVKLIFT